LDNHSINQKQNQTKNTIGRLTLTHQLSNKPLELVLTLPLGLGLGSIRVTVDLGFGVMAQVMV